MSRSWRKMQWLSNLETLFQVTPTALINREQSCSLKDSWILWDYRIAQTIISSLGTLYIDWNTYIIFIVIRNDYANKQRKPNHGTQEDIDVDIQGMCLEGRAEQSYNKTRVDNNMEAIYNLQVRVAEWWYLVFLTTLWKTEFQTGQAWPFRHHRNGSFWGSPCRSKEKVNTMHNIKAYPRRLVPHSRHQHLWNTGVRIGRDFHLWNVNLAPENTDAFVLKWETSNLHCSLEDTKAVKDFKRTLSVISGSVHRAIFPPNSCTPNEANMNIKMTSSDDTRKISLKPRHNSITTLRMCGTSMKIRSGRRHRRTMRNWTLDCSGTSWGIQMTKTKLILKHNKCYLQLAPDKVFSIKHGRFFKNETYIVVILV